MAQDEKTPDFEKIRAQVRAIERLYGGKVNIKEWDSGKTRIFKVVLLWELKDAQLIAGESGTRLVSI